MSEPKLICSFSVATHLGGGERSLLELVRGLRSRAPRSYEPWVLLPKAEGPLVDQLRESGVAFDALPMPKTFFEMSRGAPLAAFQRGLRSIPGMSFYLARLIWILRKRRPALIHTNGIKCHALASIVGSATGIPVLWHLRDIIPPGPTLWTLRTLYKTTRANAVANSRATAEAFLQGDASVKVIHNGLDPAAYAPARNRDFNRELGVKDDVPIVGILGVLARWKGHIEFLKMAARLVARGSPARFVIVGAEIYDTDSDKGYGRFLRDETRKMGIADRVLFAGFRKDPVRAINGLDVLVHASIKPEPFGRVILEAMACGVPAVATAAGGVLEFVEDGKTGLLVQPGDSDGMADAVNRLLLNPGLRSTLSENGRRRFLADLTRERHVDSMISLYDSIISEKMAR